MSMKMPWLKTTKSILKIATIIYFIIGAFVFLGGLIFLFWTVRPSSSIKAGSYLIASFITIGTSVLGFVGACTDNFCMLMAYGIILVVTFAVRTISTLVLLIIAVNQYEAQLPAFMHGLPGASSPVMELMYASTEIILAFCAFYVSWAITKKQTVNYPNPRQYYCFYQPNYENPALL